MHRFLLAWSFVVCACSGSTPPSSPDAAGPAPGAFGAICMNPTDTSTECTSGVCTNSFDMLGHSVCSQKCTTAAMCPSGSMGMFCNGKGYCKP